MKISSQNLTYVALFSALISVISPITIPIGVIPISMGLFAVLLCSICLKPKLCTLAVIIYILIGMIGFPVFAGFNASPGILIGPTGGYIYSYIPLAFVVSSIINKLKNKSYNSFVLYFLAGLFGVFICYFIGTIHYLLITQSNILTALTVCVFPFVIFDLLKILGAVFLGRLIKLK